MIWSETAKQKMQVAFLTEKSPERRAWFTQKCSERITDDISQYPKDAGVRPGERTAGELQFGGFRVHYTIELDREVAFITDID